MSRSRASFLMPNGRALEVLQRAAQFATAKGMRMGPQTVSNQFMFSRGNEMWTGERRLIIAAWDVPGGCNVNFEVWVETGWGDSSANPHAIGGFFVRRGLWKLTAAMCDYIGAPQARAAFVHS